MPAANPARPITTMPSVARRTESITRCTSRVMRTAPDDHGPPARVVHDRGRREQQVHVELLARAHQGIGLAVGSAVSTSGRCGVA